MSLRVLPPAAARPAIAAVAASARGPTIDLQLVPSPLALLDRLGAAVLELDERGVIRRANAAAQTLLERGLAGRLQATSDTVRIHPADLAARAEQGPGRCPARGVDGRSFELDCSVACPHAQESRWAYVVLLHGVALSDAPEPSSVPNAPPSDASVSQAPFAVSDYVQLACAGHHSVRIDIASARHHGAIVIRDGQLWSAATEAERGMPALHELAFAEGAAVRCCAIETAHAGPRDLGAAPWERLMLDAARLHDEHTHTSAIPTSIAADEQTEELGLDDFFDEGCDAAPPAAANGASDDAFASALDAGADALLRKDYRAALQAYEQARRLRPSHGLVLANIARLRTLLPPAHAQI